MAPGHTDMQRELGSDRVLVAPTGRKPGLNYAMVVTWRSMSDLTVTPVAPTGLSVLFTKTKVSILRLVRGRHRVGIPGCFNYIQSVQRNHGTYNTCTTSGHLDGVAALV